MFLPVLLISLILIGVGVLGMAVQVLFSKKKKFPETHVGHNVEMQKLGLGCAKCEKMGSCSVNTPAVRHK